MANKSGTSAQIISLPKGGGALSGIGETFSPDLFTGTWKLYRPDRPPTGAQRLSAATQSRLQHRQR